MTHKRLGTTRLTNKITVKSTSKVTAVVDDIVLRYSERVRLIFRPVIIDNPGDPECAVKGTFIYQRRRKDDEWEDLTGDTLASLKAGEGYKLALHSRELYDLIEGAKKLYSVHAKNGVPMGVRDYYIMTPEDAGSLVKKFLDGDRELQLVVEALSNLPDPNQLIAKLQTVPWDNLAQLDAAVNLSRLQALVSDWQSRLGNSDESYWQNELEESPWVIAQAFSAPVFLFQSKAYVGGKSIDRTGGSEVDFLYEKKLTGSVAIVEIKTPDLALLRGTAYREGVFAPSAELSSAISQTLHYRDKLMRHATEFESGSEDIRIMSPRCILIAGRIEALDEDKDRIRSFELYRGELRNVELVTFDELIQKVKLLIDVLREGHLSYAD